MPGGVASPCPSAGLSFPVCILRAWLHELQPPPWTSEKWVYVGPEDSPIGTIANELDGLKVTLTWLPPRWAN